MDDDVDVEIVDDFQSPFAECVVETSGGGTDWATWNLDQSWSLGADWSAIEVEPEVLPTQDRAQLPDSSHEISPHGPTSTSSVKTKTAASNRVVWTDEETSIFLSAFDAYPKMWSKISRFLPTKTLQQIRSFGRKHLANKTDEKHNRIRSSPKKKIPSKKNVPKKEALSSEKVVQESEIVRLVASPSDESDMSEIDVEDCDDKEQSTGVMSGVSVNAVEAGGSTEPVSDEEVTVQASFSEKSEMNESVTTGIASSASHEQTDTELSESHLTEENSGTSEDFVETCTQVTDSTSPICSAADSAELSSDALNSSRTFKDSESSVATSDISEEPERVKDPREFPVIASNGTILYLVTPTEERHMERSTVTDEEKTIHAEFFDCKSAVKNEHRYLRIRNYILDAWYKSRPEYLYKTSVRAGLRSCGDVNSIGRIHRYLEQVGAINFGCDRVQYNQTGHKSSATTSRQNSATSMTVKSSCLDTVGSRRRRVRDSDGQWVCPRELQGKTISHEVPEAMPKEKKQPKRPDPFKLIPCDRFADNEPFTVDFHSSALLLMDLHSQLSRGEVAGLLGGHFTPGEPLPRLSIQYAVACRTDSTYTQCDIDPVSQLEACDRITSRQLTVVGWYHSHPTFQPNPSIRDLETQDKYQDWYGKDGSPYVGVIVSPWIGQKRVTDISCLTVQPSTADTSAAVKAGATADAVPFMFPWTESSHEWDTDHFLQQVTHVLTVTASNPHKMALDHQQQGWGAIGCINKIEESVDRWLPQCLTDTHRLQLKTSIRQCFHDYHK